MKPILIITLVLSCFSLAQDYSGTFIQQDDATTVLELSAAGSDYTGTLVNAGTETFKVEASVEEGLLYGFILLSEAGYEQNLYFEAELTENTLNIVTALLDASGAFVEESMTPYSFTRSGVTAAAPYANPLGQNSTFAGSYRGQDLELSLQEVAGGYEGSLTFQGTSYPIEATPEGERLVGSFSANGQSFPIEASLSATTLMLVSGGETYTLVKDEASANPLAGGSSANPLTTASPVIAKGSYVDLTEDNTLAVYEAYTFSLQQLGYTEAFTEADKQAFFDFATREYPNTDQETQLILQRAREVWTNTQANWENASLEEQRGFVLAVLALIHGEEAVQQSLGTGQAANGNQAGRISMLNEMGCASVDTCMSHLDPEGYSDMVNAQNCWAGGGCESYDAETNTFYEEPTYYEEPSYDVPSYDSYD